MRADALALRKAVKAVNEVLGVLQREHHPEATAAHCWKQTNLWEKEQGAAPQWEDHKVEDRIVLPAIP